MQGWQIKHEQKEVAPVSLSLQLMSNSFSILDAEMNSIGGGVYIV